MSATPSGMRWLGGLRSRLDARDHPFSRHPAANAMAAAPIARRVDHRPNLPPAWDQSFIGSCEAHGCPRSAMPWWLETMPSFMPSRLDAYARARQKGGFPLYSDSGCFTRDMLKVMREGLYDEQVWPYDPSEYAAVPPDAERVFMISGYTQITDAAQLLAYINGGGCAPFSMLLPDYFEATQSDGLVRPYNGEHTIGGHCMCVVGYDMDMAEEPTAIVCNSWSDLWGDRGHCYIPFSMILGSLGGDVWSVYRSTNL